MVAKQTASTKKKRPVKKVNIYVSLPQKDYNFIREYARIRGYLAKTVLEHIIRETISKWKKG